MSRGAIGAYIIDVLSYHHSFNHHILVCSHPHPFVHNTSFQAVEEIKNDIRELRTGSNGQPNRGKPNPTQLRACYGCGQTDHMVRSCPFKATPDTHRRYGNNNYHQNRYGSRNGFHNDRTDGRTNNQSTETL